MKVEGYEQFATNTSDWRPSISTVKQEQEGIYWKRLWQQCALATGFYICGAITHIVRHEFQGNVRDIMNIAAYSLKGVLPIFLHSALNAKKIDSDSAQRFVHIAKYTSAAFVVWEGILASGRETAPRENIIYREILFSVAVTVMCVCTLAKFYGEWRGRSQELA